MVSWLFVGSLVVLPAAFGSAFVVMARRRLEASRAFARAGRQMAGVVVEVRPRRPGGDRRRLSYHPVLDFTLPDGRRVRTESDSEVNDVDIGPGAPVPVLYDPDDPTRARIAGEAGDHTIQYRAMIAVALLATVFITVIGGLIGGVLLLGGPSP